MNAPICIIKNCVNPGKHKVVIDIDSKLKIDVSLDEGPEIVFLNAPRYHEVYLCDEDFAIVDAVKYLSIEDTKI